MNQEEVLTEELLSKALTKPAQTSRQLAWQLVEKFRIDGAFLSNAIDSLPMELDDRNRIQAMSLAEDVVRRKATLDAILQKFISGSKDDKEQGLWTALQIGTTQLLLRPQITEHAAINETVEIAKWIGMERWTGYINGILRNIQRSISEEDTLRPTTWSFPISLNHRFVKLTKPVFSSPEKDPVRYYSIAFSFPRWLIKKWSKRMSFEEVEQLGFHFMKSGFPTFRVNPMKVSRDELLARWTDEGVNVSVGQHPLSIRMNQPMSIAELSGYDEKLFSIQDETTMQAVSLLNPHPGETILDLCSAPGTKTVQIAEAMNDQGTVVATDVSSTRLEKVSQAILERGFSCARTELIFKEDSNWPEESYDGILIDAPCSNTGVLGKRPEARWRITRADIDELVEIQKQLLLEACKKIRVGGRVVYSTCSMEPEENELLVKSVLESNPQMSLVEEIISVANGKVDGGYAALLTKSE